MWYVSIYKYTHLKKKLNNAKSNFNQKKFSNLWLTKKYDNALTSKHRHSKNNEERRKYYSKINDYNSSYFITLQI